MFPRAEAAFKWVGISLLWAPSSYLPTQVKGGHGRGWAQSACMKLCAGPAPQLPVDPRCLHPAGSLTSAQRDYLCSCQWQGGWKDSVGHVPGQMGGGRACWQGSKRDSAKHRAGEWALHSSSQATRPPGKARYRDAWEFSRASRVPGGQGGQPHPTISTNPGKHWQS